MQKNNNKINNQECVKTPWTTSSKFALIVATGLLISGCASTNASKERTLSNQLLKKIDERDQKIAERDREIDDLQHRMKQLETANITHSKSGSGNTTAAVATAAVATAQTAEKTAVATVAPQLSSSTNQPATQQAKATPGSFEGNKAAIATEATTQAAEKNTVATASAQPSSPTNQPPAQQKDVATQQAKPAPGSFEVDEDAAQRALERTLVQTGALLLPFGQAEIQPFVTYARREDTLPLLFSNSDGIGLTNNVVDRDVVDVGANFLFGLPFESQLEFRIPYRIVNQSETGLDSSGVRINSDDAGNHIGDISVGLAKTLVHESEWIPNLIARLTYQAPTGAAVSNRVIMGDGFNAFTVSMVALKRQDPLAFTARIAYKNTLEKHDFKPGDQIGFSIGTTLAASPQTSLSIGFQQNFTLESKRNNTRIQGSDYNSSVFTIGAASTIGRNFFFSVSGGIGLTRTSPDYFINLTIPFRFSIPFK